MVLSATLAPVAVARPQGGPEMGEVLEFELARSAPSWRLSADTPLPTELRTLETMRDKFPLWDSYEPWYQEALMSAPDPNIQAMLSKMDMNDMKNLFYSLETQFSLPNRATKTQNYLKSTDWVKALVQARRPTLDVQWHDESRGYRNVIITQLGQDPAAPQVSVGGHLDSVPAGPGMDDDGAGALGSAWIGLAMAGYKFKSTVTYILFDAEESGLIGSGHYVGDIKAALPPCTASKTDNCLSYYLNLDMLASDPSNLNRYNVRCNKQPIIDLHTQAKTDYTIQIGQSPSTSTGGGSDHVPYKNNGYDHCMNSEPTFSQNYHKSSDTINGTGSNGFNWDTLYGTLITSAAVLATSAGM
ncbi:MAG TPA: M28 family peptidase, partial [Thermoplasmata archaeon]|nr:M28 family peptidase [Thermoplasmata archaeon]